MAKILPTYAEPTETTQEILERMQDAYVDPTLEQLNQRPEYDLSRVQMVFRGAVEAVARGGAGDVVITQDGISIVTQDTGGGCQVVRLQQGEDETEEVEMDYLFGYQWGQPL
jgi:hypothetical protein